MPALVSPAALVSPGLSSTSSPARGRQADEPQGRSFHAALDRSRASQANTDASDPTDSATARPGTPRRGASVPKDDTLPQIPNLDFFVPAVSAQVTTAAARTGAEAVTAAALRGAATATERTDVQAALAGTDTVADAAKAVTEPDLPTAEAAAKAALADGAPADASATDALRAAAGKTSTAVSAQADAAAATAKADAAAVPATPVAPSLLNAALASTVPATPAPAARTGRTDAASRDTAATAVTTTTAAAATAEADPLDLLAARIEAATGNDAGLADDSAPNTPLAWMAAQPGSAGIGNGAATTESRVPVLSLAPPVDSDAWAPALGQQMLRMSASGMHTAQLNLNPENLGPLQITLKLGDDQAQAMFVSGHESVRKAVEAALPQLRTTLAEHGISLGQTAVGADTRQPGSQSSFASDNPSGRSGGNGGSAYPGAARSGTVASSAVPAAAVRNTRPEGVVDTFA
ncbi:flagellar hook-length control protein FliK [Variovorax arabinosiphilus]|uniref:flagellar hook-length control protein FliK n=1 Tax=Variovorax arabinosiphilus TaxID=3053498 RepID=UPI0025757312|nr:MULTISPECIES: flagellar hook-length control protein FliK [unclassified Variovorax]MDM0118173.1 flagellar hook-length control protein FliK [Variovorax sp. J2L1-78]MDM0128598.1 flagellar hook-length control protein FliK [Variovorax sp. J2L1-63]MDM0233616.1 flagellar hook-length control protein FliK [Variovorax sp. J2R1-6]